jgi:hypothetical protein
MRDAFMFYFTGENKEISGKIKMDAYCWSRDYETDSTLVTPGGVKVECSDIYIDERSVDEYEQFKIYFENRIEDQYL